MAKVSAGTAATGLAPMSTPDRAGRLRPLLEGAGCEALLVTGLANVRYLCGFSGSAGMLWVGPDELVLVTDGRYRSQAATELASAGVEAHVEAWPAYEQPGVLAKLSSGLGRVGLESHQVSWARQREWGAGWAAGTELLPTTGLVEGLRAVKDRGELARLAVAAGISDAALAAASDLFRPGASERELARALDWEMRSLGADGPAFETIVGSGPNGAEPHHHPGARPLQEGDTVVVDFGARLDGYCSDMTRTLVVGPAARVHPQLRRAAQVVLAAQDAGLAAVRAGAGGREVDRACREVVGAAGMSDLFVHGTGHGVGLDIHEAPGLGLSSTDILSSGQVVTVEPGVYIPGLGGVRTEDTVLVTEAGCQVLTLTPKDAQAGL